MCRKAKGPVAVLVPMGGFSAFNSPGGPLEDPDVRREFAKALRASLPGGILYIESGHHINDPEFAMEIMDCIKRLVGMSETLSAQ